MMKIFLDRHFRKIIIGIVFCFAMTGSASASISLIATSTCSLGSTSCTMNVSSTVGNLMYVWAYSSGQSFLSVSSSLGSVFQVAEPFSSTTISGQQEIFYAIATSTGADIITCTRQNFNGSGKCLFASFSGISSSSLDKVATSTSSTSTPVVFTSATDELLIGHFSDEYDSFSPSGTYSTLISVPGPAIMAGLLEYKIVSPAGGYNATASSSASTAYDGIDTFEATDSRVVPSISSFGASPTYILAGATATLSWSVNNASSVGITADTGSFSLSTTTLAGSVAVNPTSTTIYTLIATDVSGTATSTQTVTIDSTPPTTPTSVVLTAMDAGTVNLTWATSTDISGPGLGGYIIFRCTGSCTPTSSIATSSIPSYIDLSVTPSTTYTYAIQAYDISGLTSGTSTDVQVTTPSSSILFFDDFETGDLSAWSGTQVTTSTLNAAYENGVFAISTSTVHSGEFSFKGTLPTPGGSSKLLAAVPTSTALYSRFYFYIDPAYTEINPVVIYEGTTQIYLIYSAGSFYLQDGNGNRGVIAVSKGVWHSIEVHTVSGSGDGLESVSLDGAQDIYLADQTIAGPFTTVYLGFDNADGTQTGTIYFDDFEVSTGPIGTPAANLTVRYPDAADRSSIPIDVTMWGESSNDILTASVDSSTVYTQIGSITGHERFSIDMSSLSAGTHFFEVQLENASGTQKAIFNGTITKYINGLPSGVYINADNDIYLNGQPYFPVSPFIDGSAAWQNQWLANHSVNTYGWSDCWENNYAYNYTEFNTCMNTVNAPFIGPDGNWTGENTSTYAANLPNAVSTVTGYVTNDKSNPNLFMWTWQDEPSIGPAPGHVAPSVMLALTQATNNNDPNHPVIVNFGGYYPVTDRQDGWYYPVVPNSAPMVSDVFASDMYPLIYQTSGWTIAEEVSAWDSINSYIYHLAPWIPFIEAGLCDISQPCSGYGPTPAQVNMEAWLAVIHGAKGVSWWGPTGWTDETNLDYGVLSQFVTDTAHFASAILSSTTLSVATNRTGGGADNRVDAMIREDANNIYIFATRLTDVNESSSVPLSTTFTISGATPTGNATVYNEGRTVPITNGILTDNFNDSAVHIYVISISQTLSPSVSSFSPSPQSITEGGSATLSWSVTNASSVSLSGNNLSMTTSTLAGSISVTPNTTGNLPYTLDAANAVGTSTASLTLTVNAPASGGGGGGGGGGGYYFAPTTPSSTPSSTASSSSPGNGASLLIASSTLLSPSSTVSSLESTLLSLVKELCSLVTQAQTKGISLPSSTLSLCGSTPSFTKDLFLGMRDPEVRTLQTYLNTHGFIVNPVPGYAGSPGYETSYFGMDTKLALQKFQASHGIPATGYFGPITRAYMGRG